MFPDIIGITRGKQESVLYFNNYFGPSAAEYNGIMNIEFQEPRSSQTTDFFIDYSYPEWPDCKHGKWDNITNKKDIFQIIRRKRWDLLRTTCIIRKCESKIKVPKSTMLSQVWIELAPEINKYLNETARSFNLFFLNLYYRRYSMKKTNLRLSEQGLASNEVQAQYDEFEMNFMNEIRESMNAGKNYMAPYVYVRIWKNGTGMGNHDFDRVVMQSPSLPQTNYYQIARRSLQPIKFTENVHYLQYDEEEEEKQHNNDENYNWR